MEDAKVFLLGVPFDNLTLKETSIKIFDLIPNSSTSQYVSTINTDFLINILGWNFSHPANPKLLDAVEKSAFVTPDGQPLVWLSRLLNFPLKERVTGSDLVPLLAETLAKHKMSFFLLGGTEKGAEKTAEILKDRYPGLQIAGIATPFIKIEEKECQSDKNLIEQINRAAPHILLVGLGNPKQEIWFDRVRNQLQVPVSIGIGGTFSLVSGDLPRAPVWMQTSGLEWLYRLLQEPKRLFKRYFKDFFNALFLITPLLIFHTLSKYKLKMYTKKPFYCSSFVISPNKNIVHLALPTYIDQQAFALLKQQFNESLNNHNLIIDFKNLKHIDLIGISLIFHFHQRMQKLGKKLYCLDISTEIKLLLFLHRAWNLLKKDTYKNMDHLINDLYPS